MADNKKIGKILGDIVSGKTPGRGAANPNFPYGEMVDPVYSPNSGNGPIGDPGYNQSNYPKKPVKKIPKKFKPYPRPNN